MKSRRRHYNLSARAEFASSMRLLKGDFGAVEACRPVCAVCMRRMAPRTIKRGLGVTLAVWNCVCGQHASKQIAGIER